MALTSARALEAGITMSSVPVAMSVGARKLAESVAGAVALPCVHRRGLSIHELERVDHPRRVAGEFGDVEWRSIVGGGADAAVVEQDDLVAGREPINERWVPVGARRGEPVEK